MSRRRSALYLLLVVGLAVATIVALTGAAGTLATLYLRRAIANASTPETELEALCRANRWFHNGRAPGYSVITEDADGVELRPWRDGSYERVTTVTLKWSNGMSVRRTLLSRRPLSCVFGE